MTSRGPSPASTAAVLLLAWLMVIPLLLFYGKNKRILPLNDRFGAK